MMSVEGRAAYIYRRTADVWRHEATLMASEPQDHDQFAAVVAISGDGEHVFVASHGFCRDDADHAGRVDAYHHGDEGWSHHAPLLPAVFRQGDLFGFSMSTSIDGSTVAVGAIGQASESRVISAQSPEDGFGSPQSGAVYLFRRTDDVYAQFRFVKAFNADENDRFGQTVALSGDGTTLLVGAPLEDSAATGVDGDAFDNSVPESGAAYLYQHTEDESVWELRGYLKPFNTGADDRFGAAVGVTADGAILLVGAPGEDSDATGIAETEGEGTALDSGAAYVFGFAGTTLSQRYYLKGVFAGDANYFGAALDVAGDGTPFVVGTPGDRHPVPGIGPPPTSMSDANLRAGAVYVFE